jgi:FAD/FMN-containing dehydrogenase/Fe-S oxidoreductase
VSTLQIEDFTASLRPRIEGELLVDSVTRGIYATDASLFKMMPMAVLRPRTVADVQAALEVATRYGIPVLARGGASSLAGQTTTSGLVIDFSRHLNRILEINIEERWARVEAGAILDTLNASISMHGLSVGPDPASSSRATLGGMVANNSTGTHSIVYGNMIAHTRSANGFLADGTPVSFGPMSREAFEQRADVPGPEGRIYGQLAALLREKGTIIERDTPKHWRRNNGYRAESLLLDEVNLAQLMCGAEGTLAVLTDVTVDLVPVPKYAVLGVVHFTTLRESLEAAKTILETRPSAIELFDGHAIEACRRSPGFAPKLTFMQGDPGSILITEYRGEDRDVLLGRLDNLAEVLREAGLGYAIVRATETREIKNVWDVRKEGLGIIMSVKGDSKPQPFIEDAAVPVECLPDYIDELTAFVQSTGTRLAMYAHASAGCLHIRPFLNTKEEREVAKMKAIAEASANLVVKYGGVVSSEHGDGLARSWLIERVVGPQLYQVYRDIKEIFDPQGILNPGKIVDPPPMTENLRIDPSYQPLPIAEELDFSDDGGFMGAIEMCNGNGACRKLQSGTMCPSYMVTLEEEHSTRGRANALRMAMSGETPREELYGPRMYEVMDLCIECKGCKTECPSNVDMTRIKTEWLSRYWQHNRMPLRTRLFANIPFLSRRIKGSAAAALNWINRQKATRLMMARTLGISDKRSLPEFAVEPFMDWYRKRTWQKGGRRVVLFADTFNNYNHPEVSRAAALFLEAAGYEVQAVGESACCGRTLISKGLVTEAQVLALKTVDILYPFAEKGIPVVGLEPSCILTLRDEFLAMLPGDTRARTLAGVAFTFEEFVASEADAGRMKHLEFETNGSERALLHGHCHQKAMVGTGPSERCLALAGLDVTTIDSGCCGMAGAFGYETEHYDISIRMAERKLAPAVRASSEQDIIAAAGTSCRAQIFDTTGRGARHPAEILYSRLKATT